MDYICSELEPRPRTSRPNSRSTSSEPRPKAPALAAGGAPPGCRPPAPLFNGGTAAHRYFGDFKRKSDGVHYVSQTYDERKWAVAAAAAKRVMDLGIYRLHTVPADEYTVPLPANVPSAAFPQGAGGIDPFRSYSEMFTGETTNVTNPGADLGHDAERHRPAGRGLSPETGRKQLDQHSAAHRRCLPHGRRPRHPQRERGVPYEDRPYDQTCVTTADKQLSKNYRLPGGTYKAYDNREPRFYASIGFSGALWQMESTTSEEMRNQIVEY